MNLIDEWKTVITAECERLKAAGLVESHSFKDHILSLQMPSKVVENPRSPGQFVTEKGPVVDMNILAGAFRLQINFAEHVPWEDYKASDEAPRPHQTEFPHRYSEAALKEELLNQKKEKDNEIRKQKRGRQPQSGTKTGGTSDLGDEGSEYGEEFHDEVA